MLKVGVILGSTRPNRVGEGVARWVHEHAQKRGDAEYSLIDVRAQNLPLLDEPKPPAMGQYEKDHTRAWSEVIQPLDAFVFVTAEYNHGIPAALKNAIDFLWSEWNEKAAGFVSYGSAGGSRSVEALRLVMAEIRIADVRSQLLLNLGTDFKDGALVPTDRHRKMLDKVLDDVLAWGEAMRTLRRG